MSLPPDDRVELVLREILETGLATVCWTVP